jgi:hypothetical protein
LRRDFDGDGDIDIANLLKPTHLYTQSQLYRVSFAFEENGDMYFFPLRVGESDTPVCMINSNVNKTALSARIDFQNKQFVSQAKDYRIDLINEQDGKIIDTLKSRLSEFNYTFKKSGSYYLKGTYILDDGKQGTCESESFQVGALSYDAQFGFTYLTPSIKTPQSVGSSGVVIQSGDRLLFRQLPVRLFLKIQSLVPNVPVIVKIGNTPLLPSRDGQYEISIDDESIETLSVFAKENGDEVLIRMFTVQVDQPKIL